MTLTLTFALFQGELLLPVCKLLRVILAYSIHNRKKFIESFFFILLNAFFIEKPTKWLVDFGKPKKYTKITKKSLPLVEIPK